MDGFKKLVKMKTGGSVNKACGGMMMKKGGKCAEGGKVDIAQDKAIVKKAFNLHDKQKHENGKTDLSTLKKGGRSKKAVGTVKKYKAGGAIGMKKDAGDIQAMKKTKEAAKSGTKAILEKYKKGGKAKKCAHGGPIVSTVDPKPIVDSRRYMADGGSTSDVESKLMKATKSTSAAQQALNAAKAAGLSGGMAKQQGPYSDAEIDATFADMAKRGDFSHTGD